MSLPAARPLAQRLTAGPAQRGRTGGLYRRAGRRSCRDREPRSKAGPADRPRRPGRSPGRAAYRSGDHRDPHVAGTADHRGPGSGTPPDSVQLATPVAARAPRPSATRPGRHVVAAPHESRPAMARANRQEQMILLACSLPYVRSEARAEATTSRSEVRQAREGGPSGLRQASDAPFSAMLQLR